MLRPSRLSSVSRLSRDAQWLITLSQAYVQSGSRLEDEYWDQRLTARLDKILLGRRNQTVEHALDHLHNEHPQAYDILVDHAEARAESAQLEHEGRLYNALLLVAPLALWTRYQLPHVPLPDTLRAALAQALTDHVAAAATQVAVLPELVGFDDLPQTFQTLRQWTQRLGQVAIGQPVQPPRPDRTRDDDLLLADARFVVAVVVAPQGEPLLRWQEQQPQGGYPTREQCHAGWADTIAPLLGPLLTGCHVDYLPVQAYYSGTRHADQHLRPLALRAAVAWLQHAAQLAPSELRATIAACGDQHIEEYRVGFSPRDDNDVIYGSVWPILTKEEAVSQHADGGPLDVAEQVAEHLRELGLGEVRQLPGQYATEFCDDCGTPYFPGPLGDLQHPEMPEEIDARPPHFH